MDPDGVKWLPSWYHVVCFDNLNSLDADTPERETERLTQKKPKPRTTYEGFMNNTWLQYEINDFISWNLWESLNRVCMYALLRLRAGTCLRRSI